MEVGNILPPCKKSEHQQNPLVLICLNEKCHKDRVICPICFVDSHFSHKEKVYKLAEVCSKLIDEPDEMSQNNEEKIVFEKSFDQLSKMLKKARENCFQFYDDLEILLLEKKKEILTGQKVSRKDRLLGMIERKNPTEIIDFFNELNLSKEEEKNRTPNNFEINQELNIAFSKYLSNIQKTLSNINNYESRVFQRLQTSSFNQIHLSSLISVKILNYFGKILKINLFESSLELLYDANRDGYLKKSLQEKCKSKLNCIWIFKTDHGTVILGFNEGELFSTQFDSIQKFVITNLNQEICLKPLMSQNTEKEGVFFEIKELILLVEDCNSKAGSKISRKLFKEDNQMEMEDVRICEFQVFEILI